jgi:hypothetical protein
VSDGAAVVVLLAGARFADAGSLESVGAAWLLSLCAVLGAVLSWFLWHPATDSVSASVTAEMPRYLILLIESSPADLDAEIRLVSVHDTDGGEELRLYLTETEYYEP